MSPKYAKFWPLWNSKPKTQERVAEPIEKVKTEDKKQIKSGRERRFFKGRKDGPKYVMPTFNEEEKKEEVTVFKMPQIPMETDDMTVPEATR